MTEKQQYLLKLFREIDEMCKKHNLRYVMAGGSLIGVARNEGFIPWDDDVDIYMPRDDWNKLVELSDQVLPPNRAFQCVDVDRSYTNTFPRYASTDTCAIHRHQIIGKDKAGEIIDVLTLDPIPDDDREYRKIQNTPDDLFRSDQHSSGVWKPLRGTGSSVSEISFFPLFSLEKREP